MEPHDAVIYWDASAILSALFTDRYSDEAQAWAHRPGLHLMSTLAYAETCAVIARIRRQRLATEVLTEARSRSPRHRSLAPCQGLAGVESFALSRQTMVATGRRPLAPRHCQNPAR